jgi:hypothetical protein
MHPTARCSTSTSAAPACSCPEQRDTQKKPTHAQICSTRQSINACGGLGGGTDMVLLPRQQLQYLSLQRVLVRSLPALEADLVLGGKLHLRITVTTATSPLRRRVRTRAMPVRCSPRTRRWHRAGRRSPAAREQTAASPATQRDRAHPRMHERRHAGQSDNSEQQP